MSAVSDRAKSLARIGAVQAEMVRLAEWRLAAARRRREGLDQERALLAALVGGPEPLGAVLARAALRTTRALDGRIAAAESEIAAHEQEVGRLRRRDKALTELGKDAKAAARRETEALALGAVMEAWLARASLP